MANAQLRYRIIENERGKPSLVYEDYRFQVKSRCQDRIYWVCAVRFCSARVTTLNMIPTDTNPHHNHQPDRIQNHVLDTMNKIKKRCREETKPIPQVYNVEISKLRTPELDITTKDTAQRLPTYQACHSILYRQRAKLLPKLPTNLRDLTLQGGWTTTTAGDPFLLADDGADQRILIFATQDNLRYLADADTIFADGTFYTCPDIFTQIYSFHAEVAGKMFPLVFALLPGKSQQIYTRLFRLLRSTCHNSNIVLRPQTIFLDFETAAHNAARAIFPGIQILFLPLYTMRMEISPILRTPDPLPARSRHQCHRQTCCRAAVLPLVLPTDVEDVWLNALEELGESSSTTTFTDYITTHWVEGEDMNKWNHYHTDGPRTTNNLEGWHVKMNRQVQHAHPNIFIIIGHLKQIQAANEVNILQLTAGGVPRPKRRKYRDVENNSNSND